MAPIRDPAASSGGLNGPCRSVSEGPGTPCCCCRCCCCSCYCSGGAEGSKVSSHSRRSPGNTSSDAAPHEAPSPNAAFGADMSTSSCTRGLSQTGCKQSPQQPGSDTAAQQSCTRHVSGKNCRDDPTGPSATQPETLHPTESSPTETLSASRALPSGCGSTECFLLDGLRPRRLCICMVSDFFFPSLGGVEMHIYELSVRLARNGEQLTLQPNGSKNGAGRLS